MNSQIPIKEQLESFGLAEGVVHDSNLPSTKFSRVLEKTVVFFGKTASWIWLVAVSAILISVIARYVFGQGSVMLEEIQWHLAGAAWLIGLSYALIKDEHVRADLLYEKMPRKIQVWVELLGITFLLLPFLLVSFYELIPYAMASFEQSERSAAPAGLPARWFLKMVLAFSFLLLIVGTVARLIGVVKYLLFKPSEADPKMVSKSYEEINFGR